MSLLEIVLLILITYGLLATGRKKPQAKKRPTQTTTSPDLALEEALREIREAMRRSESEIETDSSPSFNPTFHSQKQERTTETSTPAFHHLEMSPNPTRSSRTPMDDEQIETFLPERISRHVQAKFWQRRLRQRKSAQEAIMLAELLGPPRARRPWRPRLDHIG